MVSWSKHRARLGVAVVVFASLAACSGDDASPSTTVPATTDEGTTDEGTTTTAPVATSETTSTTSTTTSSTTTTDPATTVPDTTTTTLDQTTPTSLPDGVPPRVTFPDDPDKQAVVDVVYAYLDALSLASAAPAESSLRDDLGRWTTEPIEPRVLSFLDELVVQNERVIPSEVAPWYVRVLAPSVEVSAEAAALDACIFDTDIKVAVGGAPDGSDLVLDDSFVSSYQTFLLVRDDLGWRIREISEFGRFEGEDQCA